VAAPSSGTAVAAPGTAGVVTDVLRRLVARQVDEHGLVVWYDPERYYERVARVVAPEHAAVAVYEGSFFDLRHRVDSWLEGETAPRLVIYVPRDRAGTGGALMEAELAGAVLHPGADASTRNTRLSVLARRALRDRLGQEALSRVVKQVDANVLSLEELDQLGERGSAATGTLALIFGTDAPPDLALRFLGSDAYDATLTEKRAVPDLWQLLVAGYDLPHYLTIPSDPAAARALLVRHVLTTDLLSTLAGAIPTALTGLPAARQPVAREACRELAQTWRLRRDLSGSYAAQAQQVEEQLRLGAARFAPGQLDHVQTFLATETALQALVEAALAAPDQEDQASVAALSPPTMADLVERVTARQSGFWSQQQPEVQARWALIAASGQMLLTADRVSAAWRHHPPDAAALFAGYTAGDQPWRLLDAGQRHLERRANEFDLGAQHEHLQQLVARARRAYMDAASLLAEAFVHAYHETGFHLPGVLRQRDIYGAYVLPALDAGKTAYVLVDALRFEMAADLLSGLDVRFEHTLLPAIATFPTLTAVGMAALLPRAERDLELAAGTNGKLTLKIAGQSLKVREDRLDYLVAQAAGRQVCPVKLADLLPARPALQARIKQADLILVTSQEIDLFGEGDDARAARQYMDGVLRDLQRAFRALADLGVRTIVVSADHGYLFGDALDSAARIDPPGGKTVELSRRVWVGQGGAASPAFLRARAADFGLKGDLELATPWGFACFKSPGGAAAYFHGGLSPQELIIPVAVLTARPAGLSAREDDFTWRIEPGSKAVSTRFFSATVSGVASSMLDVAAPRVRLELRDSDQANTTAITTMVSATYGFDEATGNVQLRYEQESAERRLEPDRVTLLLVTDQVGASVRLVLLDADTGRELVPTPPPDPLAVKIAL